MSLPFNSIECLSFYLIYDPSSGSCLHWQLAIEMIV